MNKIFKLKSIITQTYFIVFVSFLMGVIITFIWISSENKWEKFLRNSYSSGISLYNNIKFQNKIDNKIKIKKIDVNDEVISKEQLDYHSEIPLPYKLTTLSISDYGQKSEIQEKIILHLLSKKLRYPISKIEPFNNLAVEQQLGKVIELVANYCTNPIIFIKINQGFWYRVDGNNVWGCKTAPNDYRMLSIILLVITFFSIFFLIRNTELKFNNFILNLKNNLKSRKGTM